jgi:polyvinyl alcohol dehydrogenase (cytochrome)
MLAYITGTVDQELLLRNEYLAAENRIFKAQPNGSVDLGPMAVANGVVYASSMAGSPATAPTMFAMDASTGKTVWSFAAGSSVNAGATIVNGNVYWGSGYAHLGIPGYTGNNKFYAFTKNGN